jgi:lipopolysaccharide heptosyltransferase II
LGRKGKEPVIPKSALVVKLGQIGDVVMSIPAARGIHERGYEIHWVCGCTVQPLLACYSWIHLIPVIEKAILFGGLPEKAAQIAGLWRRLAFRPFDLCATLYYDRRYRVLTWPVRAKQRITLSRRSRATMLLPGRHHVDEYARVLLGRDDGYREQSAAPVRPDRLPPSPLPAKTTQARVAIVPGGVRNLIREEATGRLPEQVLRRWPIENYIALTRRLLDRGWEVVLLGGTEDEWVRPNFRDLAVTNCIGKLSLPEVVSVCDASDAVVTHDTGPLHLAGLSDTCLIGIFGPTDPATRIPRRPFSIGIWGGQGFACRPCYDGRDFAPCKFNGCMHQVTPELALRELDRLLDARLRGETMPWRIVVPDIETGPGFISLGVNQIKPEYSQAQR